MKIMKNMMIRGSFVLILSGVIVIGLSCSSPPADPIEGQQFNLVVNTEGLGTVDPQVGTYEAREKVYVTATAGAGYHFAQWEGDTIGILSKTLITMTKDTVITAIFDTNSKTLTITKQGEGSTSPASGDYDTDSTQTLTAVPAVGWHFVRWEGDIDSTEKTYELKMTSDKNITAVFEEGAQYYSLTMKTTGEGTVTPASGMYTENDNVTLTAQASDGWHFTRWNGDASGSDTSQTITMTKNKTITAVFEQDTVSYALATNVTGSGSISPSSGVFDNGTTLTLTATPDSGWRFVRWEGDVSGTNTSIEVIMNANREITGVFEEITYTLTVSKIGSGFVSVQPQLDNYTPGSVVTLTASPNPGYEFSNWSFGASGDNTTTNVTINQNTTVVAIFTIKPLVNVRMETSLGTIELELDGTKAPKTVENFVTYANNGFFDGEDGLGATIFHRVIDGFMIQGGGFTGPDPTQSNQKETLDPIINESANGLSNIRGTIAMARTNDPNSATSQFFINVVDNLFLDYKSAAEPGYAVFGRVTSGMEVADNISLAATHSINGFDDVPVDTITITNVEILP
jgi:cyclophilin family peptidyl-prolyl cis-trans isomerase